ncbi:neural cell adhesion molecule 1-A-like [Homarus americanus]|uniref:neural cell adhesion molecule 1-A-like n=1 Tax=Homarus americanus TaxID=6706 RepID=UPI001C458F76|nr:neural cell adhesion molecule 1-A-like [Homarus americanus]
MVPDQVTYREAEPVARLLQIVASVNSPTVRAALGRSLVPSLLKEGDDVYFNCDVDANPPATTITWYHERGLQAQNITAGIILVGNTLVLQVVNRSRAGRYRCEATNPLGTVTSNPVLLWIKYAPECHTSPTTYFIYDKPIKVSCRVSSFPPVSSVLWQWNNSVEVLRNAAVTHHDLATAFLTVYPQPQHEDRALSCWAVNEMGVQQKPCAFTIKVAKMPLPLSSCRLANITASSLSLTCQRPHTSAAGTTLYRAEVYFENHTLFANVTSTRPNFNVSRLDADTSYQIKVYVSHGPVTSQPVVVSAYTSRTSRAPTGESQGLHKITNITAPKTQRSLTSQPLRLRDHQHHSPHDSQITNITAPMILRSPTSQPLRLRDHQHHSPHDSQITNSTAPKTHRSPTSQPLRLTDHQHHSPHDSQITNITAPRIQSLSVTEPRTCRGAFELVIYTQTSRDEVDCHWA